MSSRAVAGQMSRRVARQRSTGCLETLEENQEDRQLDQAGAMTLGRVAGRDYPAYVPPAEERAQRGAAAAAEEAAEQAEGEEEEAATEGAAGEVDVKEEPGDRHPGREPAPKWRRV